MQQLLQNKKGADLRMVMFSLVTAIVVLLFIIKITNMVSDPSEISNLVLAKDTALTMQAVSALQDDVYYNYPLSYDRRNVHIGLEKTGVLLSIQEFSINDAVTPTYYYFLPSKQYRIQGGLFDAAAFHITKIGNEISIENGSLQDQSAEELQVLTVDPKTVQFLVQTQGDYTKVVSLAKTLEKNYAETYGIGDVEYVVYIILDASSQYENITVSYSEESSLNTKLIAERLQKMLQGFENPVESKIYQLGSGINKVVVQLPREVVENGEIVLLDAFEQSVDGVFV